MRLDVAFLATTVERPESTVCVVIDALRASSTVATLLGRGVAEVVVAGTVEEARLVRRSIPDALLCGESGGLPPEGFDFGNSPAEFAAADLAGRSVVLATSNGTRALAALAGARAVFVGSLLNLSACARAALDAAGGSDLELALVCAGNDYGRRFSLEDAVVAGAFVERIVRKRGAPPNAENGGPPLHLTDTATAAYRLWRSYPSPRLAFGEATHGQHLAALGLSSDLDACAQLDRYDVAPRLRLAAEGRFVLT